MSNNKKMNTLLKNLVISGLIIFTFACSENKNLISDEGIEIPENSDEIIVTTRQFNATDMALDSLRPQQFSTIVNANGQLDVPPQNMVAISPYYGGYVKKIDLLEGQKVNKGQTLVILENPEYVQFQQEYLEIKEQLDYLKSEYERQKVLAEENITAQKNYLKAQSEYQTNLAKFKGLRKKLELLNINLSDVEKGNFTSTIDLSTPISGKICKINTSRGSFINPADIAIEIINTDHIHLELEVFEKDILKLKGGQSILFRLPNSGNENYEAEVHLVSSNIEDEKRVVKVHGHIKDEEKYTTFLPGMYVEAQIQIDHAEGIAIPKEAVVNIDGEDYLLVQKSRSQDHITLEKKKVITGRENDRYIEVLNITDLDNNSLILTKGAFDLINS